MAPHYPQRVGNWWLGECLGSGYSGAIFKATNLYNQQVVALKLQVVDHECPTNRYERGFYPTLQGGEGMPTLFASGVEAGFDWLAISLLGPSLDSLYRKSGRKTMDLRSVCCIAMQMITRLETMHNRGILHRDIQLGNCVIGLTPEERKIYMIDFGFSKRYIDPATGQHIEDNNKKRDFIGNYWFSSVNVHCRGRIPTRRDDMEALALMLIHLLTPGGLSWTRKGVPKTDAAHKRLKREKAAAAPEDLCRGLPDVFEEFLRYCRRLKFAECPDYEEWRERFMDLAVDSGYPEDDAFVWPATEPEFRAPVSAGKAPKAGSQRKLEGILKDLADLQLTEPRQILGERANANNVPRAKQGAPAKKGAGASVIVISTDDENESHGRARRSKAAELGALVRRAQGATDNTALAGVVRQFADVLQASKSKALTREGCAVLDAVHTQLADPSVYAVPLRSGRTRSGGGAPRADAPGGEADARRAKSDRLYALRRDVAGAKSNRMLAKMVVDFGAVIEKSRGRTVTKDAVGFLYGLADRLRAMP